MACRLPGQISEAVRTPAINLMNTPMFATNDRSETADYGKMSRIIFDVKVCERSGDWRRRCEASFRLIARCRHLAKHANTLIIVSVAVHWRRLRILQMMRARQQRVIFHRSIRLL